MQKIIVIDIETTGFLSEGGSIVEIGAVELDLTTGAIKTVFDSLCREDRLTAKHREAWIFQNSDLTPEQVRDAPPFKIVAQEFQTVIDSYPAGATAFNRLFDFTFLQDRGIRLHKHLPCPMILATNVCKLPAKGRQGYKWPKVEEAFSHFFPDTPYVEKHRGADDAYHEAMIVHRLYQIGVFKID